MKKKVLAGLLVFCMACSLCACGGNNGGENTEKNSQIENSQSVKESESESEALPEGKAIYKVMVVDEGGAAIAGATVQMCLETCIFEITNKDGVAEFTLDEADGYKAEVLALPEGYEEINEEPVYLESGKQEVTLTVKAVQ